MIVRGRLTALTILALVAGLFLTGPAPVHAQSRALVNVLSQIQSLSVNDLAALVVWAQYGVLAGSPGMDQSPGRVKAAILSLDDKDRQAVLLWLRGSGRSALYAQGASDDQIGAPRVPDDSPAPSPSPTL